MKNALSGKRVLITQATEFMGPALCDVFAQQGAEVVASSEALVEPDAAERVVATPGVSTCWSPTSRSRRRPRPRQTSPMASGDRCSRRSWIRSRGARGHPGMIARRPGKILVIGSASGLRGIKRASSYSAARGAQLAYVQAVGVEVAPHNVQVNAIAQNFVDNPTYFPAEVQANPVPGAPGAGGAARPPRLRPRGRPLRRVPLQQRRRLLRRPGVPVCGGWVAR